MKTELLDSRLVVNWVQSFLERVSFPPARPPFVRQQVETDVRVRAVVSERDQVSEEGNTFMLLMQGSGSLIPFNTFFKTLFIHFKTSSPL